MTISLRERILTQYKVDLDTPPEELNDGELVTAYGSILVINGITWTIAHMAHDEFPDADLFFEEIFERAEELRAELDARSEADLDDAPPRFESVDV